MTMDLFKVDDDVVEDGDSLPPKGSTFEPLGTGLYPMIITTAYVGESSGGAKTVNLELRAADNSGPVIKQVLYVTTGKEKGQRNHFVDDKGIKRKLRGMAQADQLHELLAGGPLVEAEIAKKIIKKYNFEARSEDNIEVEMIMGLLNKPVLVGLTKVVDNKRARNAQGKWVNTSEKKEFNEVQKFFDPDGRTLTERNADSKAVFIDEWKERFPEDHVHMKYKKVADEHPGATEEELESVIPAGNGAGEATKSLFNNPS